MSSTNISSTTTNATDSDVDRALLATSCYDVVRLNVLSSTQISSRTSAIIAKLQLGALPSCSSGNNTIIRLLAKAKVASKLITIVDICRRDLAAQGVPCFQYNALSSVLTHVVRPNNNNNTGEPSDDDDERDDDAFETMGQIESGTKLRKVPVMIVYLSKVPIRELSAAFG